MQRSLFLQTKVGRLIQPSVCVRLENKVRSSTGEYKVSSIKARRIGIWIRNKSSECGQRIKICAGCAEHRGSPKIYPHFKNHKKAKYVQRIKKDNSAEKKILGRIQSVKESKADSWKQLKPCWKSSIKSWYVELLFNIALVLTPPASHNF